MSQEMWNAPPGFRPTKSAPCSPAKPLGVSRTRSESFHVTHKVPVGDTPYVRAKNVQVSIFGFLSICIIVLIFGDNQSSFIWLSLVLVCIFFFF